MRTPVGIILAVCLVLLGVGLATAQPFRITFRRDRDEPSSIVLMGEVFNDGLREVVDVWVTAEALNAGDKIVGRGIAFVTSFLPGRGTTTFAVKTAPGRRGSVVPSRRLVVSMGIRGAIAVTVLAARPHEEAHHDRAHAGHAAPKPRPAGAARTEALGVDSEDGGSSGRPLDRAFCWWGLP